MIGLGSNRLSVCRRGGMSVTQAGKGGMEWLAGGRMPSWANPYLPYSKAAGEALVVQFPTQWPTIRDYGVAHPEIVGYMNAYAPEDAKIAYSLVPTLGVIRGLEGDGYAYINALFKPKTDTRIVAQVKRIQQLDSWDFVYGAGYYTLNWRLYLCFNVDKYWVFGGAQNLNTGVSCADGKYHLIDQSHTKSYIDGNLVATATGSPTNAPCNMYIGAVNNNGSLNGRAVKAGFGTFDIYDGETLVRKYVPFQLGTARYASHVSTGVAQSVGTCGMIDLLTGIFYPNANSSGSFTISETPPS